MPSNTPSATLVALPANVTGQLTLGGLPATAYNSSTGLLLPTSAASLSSALAAAASGTCPSCFAAVLLSLVDAAKPQTVYYTRGGGGGASTPGRRLQAQLPPLALPQGPLLLSYLITGPPTAIATLAATGPQPAFAASMAANVRSTSGWGAVSVEVFVPSATGSAAAAAAAGATSAGSDTVTIGAAVGGAVGGLALLLLLFAAYHYLYRMRSRKEVLTTLPPYRRASKAKGGVRAP